MFSESEDTTPKKQFSVRSISRKSQLESDSIIKSIAKLNLGKNKYQARGQETPDSQDTNMSKQSDSNTYSVHISLIIQNSKRIDTMRHRGSGNIRVQSHLAMIKRI